MKIVDPTGQIDSMNSLASIPPNSDSSGADDNANLIDLLSSVFMVSPSITLSSVVE